MVRGTQYRRRESAEFFLAYIRKFFSSDRSRYIVHLFLHAYTEFLFSKTRNHYIVALLS